MNLEIRLAELFHTAHNAAFACYLRKGHVLPELERIAAITREWLDYCAKKNPLWQEQPRVPAGNPDGGQWTDGGGNGRREPAGRMIDDPPLDPVYPELILPLLRTGRMIGALRSFIAAGRRDANWEYGAFKSPKRWANQIEKRNWTPDEITHTIKTGKKFPAPNFVNPANPAIRYQTPVKGRYVVRDEVTKEILQLGQAGFDPLEP